MQRDKIFSIISIVCFCSILLIPLGIAFMWLTTNWKKTLKLILSGSLSTLYVVLVVLFFMLTPSVNSNGASLPFNYSKGKTEFNTEIPSNKKKTDSSIDEFKTESWKNKGNKQTDKDPERLPRSLQKKDGGKNLSIIIPIIFFLIILGLVILRNLKKSGKKNVYENPYVDTNQYKLPLADDAKMPLVHFLKIRLYPDEKIYYATETVQKNNEGSFVVTSQRVVIINPELGQVDFPYEALEAVASVSNSVIQMTSGDRKYYIFVPENQMKYALAVLRWSYRKKGEK